TGSRSRTTPPSPSVRTRPPATPPTAGTFSTWTSPPAASTKRTSRPSTPPSRRPVPIPDRLSSACPPSSPDRHRTTSTPAAPADALGEDEVRATKEILGFDPDASFAVDDEVLAHARKVRDRGRAAHLEWDKSFSAWRSANPEAAALFDRLATRELPADLDAA